MTVKITDLYLIHETLKAILVRNKDGDEVWIPRGQISYLLKEKNHHVTLEMPEWLAKAKNLDYE